jgi:hypothetical protein
MPVKRSVSPSERISESLFKELADSSARLNSSSDELSKAIRPIDASLKKLNLGIPAWYVYRGSDTPDTDGNYSYRCIGYDKVSGKWGLALSTNSGNAYDEDDNYEAWLFNDAPRSLRIEALDYIPDLLEQLVKESNKVAEDLQRKAKHAHDLAEKISALSTATDGNR